MWNYLCIYRLYIYKYIYINTVCISFIKKCMSAFQLPAWKDYNQKSQWMLRAKNAKIWPPTAKSLAHGFVNSHWCLNIRSIFIMSLHLDLSSSHLFKLYYLKATRMWSMQWFQSDYQFKTTLDCSIWCWPGVDVVQCRKEIYPQTFSLTWIKTDICCVFAWSIIQFYIIIRTRDRGECHWQKALKMSTSMVSTKKRSIIALLFWIKGYLPYSSMPVYTLINLQIQSIAIFSWPYLRNFVLYWVQMIHWTLLYWGQQWKSTDLGNGLPPGRRTNLIDVLDKPHTWAIYFFILWRGLLIHTSHVPFWIS